MPVHSRAMSTPSSFHGSSAGFLIAVTFIGPRPASMVSPVTFTSCGKLPCTELCEEVGVGLDRAEVVDRHHLDVLAAGLDDGAQHQRPMRPKPLMATLTVMVSSSFSADQALCFLTTASATASAVMPKFL